MTLPAECPWYQTDVLDNLATSCCEDWLSCSSLWPSLPHQPSPYVSSRSAYEKAGEAAKAESNAKAYADRLAANYDAAGAAATAEANAKAAIEANQKAARTLERAAEQVEQEKKRAVNEIKNEVSEMAISIASAVIERDVSQDEHTALIDSFIEKMGD